MENQSKEISDLPAECFISVDVEASGPIPGMFSLLSIGACVAFEAASKTFYCTVKPLEGAESDPDALKVSGLSLENLAQTGKSPEEAMRFFEKWVAAVSGKSKPIFVGLNAAFDWSFVNYYFHRFLGRNPFGFSALDIKSLYMGLTGDAWADTKSSRMAKTLGIPHGKMTHHALDDAQAQAELFVVIREQSKLNSVDIRASLTRNIFG